MTLPRRLLLKYLTATSLFSLCVCVRGKRISKNVHFFGSETVNVDLSKYRLHASRVIKKKSKSNVSRHNWHDSST